MMLETGESPQQLRAKVTSPGGTTEAAMHEIERHDVPALIARAVLAARDRSRELGR
jgi:pyrroline-5-carboxylate reductase